MTGLGGVVCLVLRNGTVYYYFAHICPFLFPCTQLLNVTQSGNDKMAIFRPFHCLFFLVMQRYVKLQSICGIGTLSPLHKQ